MTGRGPTITTTSLSIHTKRHGQLAPMSTPAYTKTDAREVAQEIAKPLNLAIVEIDFNDLTTQSISDAVFICTRTEILESRETEIYG